MLFPNHDEETLVLDEIDELLDDVANGSVLIVHNDDHNTFDWVIEGPSPVSHHSVIKQNQYALRKLHIGAKPQFNKLDGKKSDLGEGALNPNNI